MHGLLYELMYAYFNMGASQTLKGSQQLGHCEGTKCSNKPPCLKSFQRTSCP
jgi:hypothetical protein